MRGRETILGQAPKCAVVRLLVEPGVSPACASPGRPLPENHLMCITIKFREDMSSRDVDISGSSVVDRIAESKVSSSNSNMIFVAWSHPSLSSITMATALSLRRKTPHLQTTSTSTHKRL